MEVLQNRKYSWVDISKGICIILMVLGHSSLPSAASRWIWSFHMPFFFIISALFTNSNKYSFKDFIVRRSRSLLIPFVIYSIINLFLMPYALELTHKEYALNILCNGWGGLALWFIPVFILSLIIYKLTPRRFLFIAGFCCLVVGAMFDLQQIALPWALSSVPFAAALMLFTGYFKTPIRNMIEKIHGKERIAAILVGLLISLFISRFYRLDMACNKITPIIPIMAGIAAGTLFCILSAQVADKIPILRNMLIHIGRNTYEVMALSQLPIILCNKYLPEISIGKHAVMIAVVICAVFLRKIIVGIFAKTAVK